MMHGDCLVRTPARPWSPALHDDKEGHNDSGISPGRSSSGGPSTSPHSPQRPLGSPNSAGHYPPSPADGSNSGYPLSPSARSTPPAPDGSLERLKHALERSNALTMMFKQEAERKELDTPLDSIRKEYPCPLCAYTTPYRHRYMEHVSTHYTDKCTICDFKGENASDLRAHLSEAHGIGSESGDIADSIDPTDPNSDGQDENDNPKRSKPKLFRCKQCSFVTATKVDFWEHNKTHIKTDKLLTCPKCPFVTEYKHHLEYHLRNHYGSKPFKCDKCSYSCVNKSMLNSHLKSHSNIYQYRCADCAYATKYCHSLKLHLRKYDHAPAMVLNQDGSPNPLPIIDVYGTRRGPKPKQKTRSDGSIKDDLPGGVIVPTSTAQQTDSPQNQPKLIGCNLCEFYTVSFEILNQHMYMHAAESPIAHMMRTNNNLPDSATMKDYFEKVFNNVDRPQSPVSVPSPNPSPVVQQPQSPLNLTKIELDSKGSASDGKKNRRKGKAYKLERIQEPDEPRNLVIDEIEEKYNGPVLHNTDVSEPAYKNGTSSDDGKINGDDHSMECDEDSLKIKIPQWPSKPTVVETPKSIVKEDSEGYSCDFCDMAFKDVIMYTMHMGYHGYRDPFTCNMCGQSTPNRVAFFLHIARSSHT